MESAAGVDSAPSQYMEGPLYSPLTETRTKLRWACVVQDQSLGSMYSIDPTNSHWPQHTVVFRGAEPAPTGSMWHKGKVQFAPGWSLSRTVITARPSLS